jgi:hypothetical protein
MSSPKKTTTSRKGHSNALSLEDLDKQYNPNVIIPARIRAGLAKLGDNAMTAMNFQREANVTTLQLVQFAEQFEGHQVVVRDGGKPKTLWCGTEAFARKVRERLGV